MTDGSHMNIITTDETTSKAAYKVDSTTTASLNDIGDYQGGGGAGHDGSAAR